MTPNFKEFQTQGRRLQILQLLANDDVRGRASEKEIQRAIKALIDDAYTLQDARADLAWLAERALVATHMEAETVMIATLQDLGFKVAKGKETVEGVERPAFL